MERSTYRYPASELSAARIARSRRRRAEERVICAILHASSPYGLFALASSALVWATQRSRSRFLSVQSLQALMFQLFAFASMALTFGLFAVGVNVAMFSGLIARTGVNEPELTSFLAGAMVLGVATSFFFQFVFPLWGVWAAVRILGGRNFRYPILGRLAVKWSSRWPVELEVSSKTAATEASDGENVLAGLAHLSMVGGLSPILAPILWATAEHRSRFLTDHLLQAALFQLVMTGVVLGLFGGVWAIVISFALFGSLLPMGPPYPATRVVGSPLFPFGCLGMLALLMSVAGLLVLVAAIRAFKGKEFRYPLLGSWLNKYLEK